VTASDQPSLAPGRYLDKIASSTGEPPAVVSIQPNGSATCLEPRRASALVTSSSGLRPGKSLRSTLRIAESPKIKLVLLCSPVSIRLSRLVSMTTPGSLAKCIWPTVT
jgi:hypothetical protein